VTEHIAGRLDGSGLHVGIAVASWNKSITDRLLDGALHRCAELNVGQVTVVHVPGALELPLAAQALGGRGCDAVVAIGTVVKGDTDHYEIVVRDSTAGISRVALDTGIPVTNAILAVRDIDQAVERSGAGTANKGVEAVDAAVLTVTALRALAAGGELSS
jgi:6,7-dimethyl-8-ribityllumazine synthase